MLTDLIIRGSYPPETVLGLAAAVEVASEHPPAAAITTAATARGLAIIPAAAAQAAPGRGVWGMAGGHRVSVGRPPALSASSNPDDQQLTALRQAGKTVVLVMIDGQQAGLIGIADQLRPEALATVTALRELGIGDLVMLTGDSPATAAAIARPLASASGGPGSCPRTRPPPSPACAAGPGR